MRAQGLTAAWKTLLLVMVVSFSASVMPQAATASASHSANSEYTNDAAGTPQALAATETTLFAGGFTDAANQAQWMPRFGNFGGNAMALYPVEGTLVDTRTMLSHAEAQLVGMIGADFTYAASVVVDPSVDMNLQFRISDSGRYGIRLRADEIAFYSFRRRDKECSTNPAVFTHCPEWPEPSCKFNCDDPQFSDPLLASQSLSLLPNSRHRVTIQAQGDHFDISLDGAQMFNGPVINDAFAVGRFGVYMLGAAATLQNPAPSIDFRDIRITTDPTRPSNFALLYSTAGYEAAATKRALVRTLNDLPAQLLASSAAGGSALQATLSSFTLTDSEGAVVKEGVLEPLPLPQSTPTSTPKPSSTPEVTPKATSTPTPTRTSQPGPHETPVVGPNLYLPMMHGATAGSDAVAALPQAGDAQTLPAKTFGMQLWAIDFSSVTAPGFYRLNVDFVTSAGTQKLLSQPFEIRAGLVTANLLKPLTLLNAEARRSADDDLRRNWIKESGSWSVGVDGAFIADRADVEGGALLTRVFNDNNWPLYAQNFRLVGQITIVSGCDAQLQFRITESERWGVTLQAGDGGGCSQGGGPGAVRLHHEGAEGFTALASSLFPVDQPFLAGHRYDVEILAIDNNVTVFVDGVARLVNVQVPAVSGRFALKAWGSTARFERVQAWDPGVTLHTSPGGVRIPYYQNIDQAQVPCQYFHVNAQYQVDRPAEGDGPLLDKACNPLFSQLHGFADANNIIGEATSHGAFLAGLMEVWSRRAYAFSMADKEALRRAIITTALYLEELFQEGGASGEFAHSEMGRGGVQTNLGPWQSQVALYGMSAFADKGAFVEKGLARLACQDSMAGADWLAQQGYFGDATAQSIIYAHLAHCTTRENFAACPAQCQAAYWQKAFDGVEAVLSTFGRPGGIGAQYRDAGRVIPWFEGVYEVLQAFPEKLQGDPNNPDDGYAPRLKIIADTLVKHLTREHPCDDALPLGALCAANGFFVLPQASGGDASWPLINWTQMDQMPLANRPTTLPYLNLYNVGHFAVSASDAVYLAMMTGRSDLEPVASGDLNWVLGLNPGIPAVKIVNGNPDGRPWQAASFIYNQGPAFARTFEGFRTEATAAKGWQGAWEDGPASPHHETWWVDPLNNGFMSIVNGHVLWDNQWDYWNNGEHGWSSGETFILYDGAFVKAALLLEDWLAVAPAPPANPYDTAKLTFFDTTHVDRADAGWGFDAPDFSNAAQASRAATEFCAAKGFGGGRFTGHYLDDRLGLLCIGAPVTFYDATDAEVASTGWDFQDINQTPWAQVARAATNFCNARGFVGGYFTGHQLNGLRGIICLGSDAATWIDATDQDHYNSGEGFSDINTVGWAKGARAATNMCIGKGYAGGFLTGHVVPGHIGIVCFIG